MNKSDHQLPPYSNFPILKGERISLREISDADLEEIIDISFYDAIQATTVEIAGEMQAKIDNDYRAGNSIHWGIVENATDKIAGTCGYYRGFENGEGELGCVLLPEFQGKGYMTAAMLLAIDFGFDEMGLKRIWAATNKKNAQAIKLLERLNFTKVGELPDDEVEYELSKNF